MQAEGGRRNVQSITAVKQRLVRPVNLNPLRTELPTDRMMDDDHRMNDEAAEVEDIEGQEEQHGVEREEPTLEDWFGSYSADEPRVHDGGLGQDVVAVEAETAHRSFGTEEEGVVPRELRKPQLVSKRERDEHERTHLPYRDWCDVCVRARIAQQLTGKDPKVMDYFYVNDKDRAEDANCPFVMIDEETGDKYSRVVDKKGLGDNVEMESMGPTRRRRTPVDPEVRW